jgi:hypothetical protein
LFKSASELLEEMEKAALAEVAGDNDIVNVAAKDSSEEMSRETKGVCQIPEGVAQVAVLSHVAGGVDSVIGGHDGIE